jgi:homoserine kinase
LIRGLAEGQRDWLKAALHDRLHQPARLDLIPGFRAVHLAATQAGAYGVVISGAGPTLLALGPQSSREEIGEIMVKAWAQMDIGATAYPLELDRQGARVMERPSPK